MNERRVLVTGAAGFLGAALARALAAPVDDASPPALLLTDCVAPRAPAGAEVVVGDIADDALQARLFARPVDAVFHLAGVVSGRAEQDFELGKRVNLDATLALLERCRHQAGQGGPAPRLVYASSIAVFGTPLPARIDDATAPAPTLSYGTHKRACELLLDDYTRRGWVDGRALRLSGVVVRPALPNGALSGFNSDLIREPLAGRDYVCPVAPDAGLWLISLRAAIGQLLALMRAPAEALGPRRALTAPALALRVAEVIEAIRRVDPAAAARIRCEPQPALEAQFGRWPRDCAFERARALGLAGDASIDTVIRHFLEATP